MEYYSAIKWNNILIDATVWMNFENILLSERNHSPKTIYFIIPIIRTGEFHGQRSLAGYSPYHQKKLDIPETPEHAHKRELKMYVHVKTCT